MEIKQEKSNETLTLTIHGEIDKLTSPILEEQINTVLDENEIKDLILDFKDVAYISSACLRVLLASQKKVNSLEKKMKIINCNNTVKEIFTMSGFIKFINIE